MCRVFCSRTSDARCISLQIATRPRGLQIATRPRGTNRAARYSSGVPPRRGGLRRRACGLDVSAFSCSPRQWCAAAAVDTGHEHGHPDSAIAGLDEQLSYRLGALVESSDIGEARPAQLLDTLSASTTAAASELNTVAENLSSRVTAASPCVAGRDDSPIDERAVRKASVIFAAFSHNMVTHSAVWLQMWSRTPRSGCRGLTVLYSTVGLPSGRRTS